MATKSPGVYFSEIDNTQYENDNIESISGTTLAVVGYATKGPTDFPVEIGSWKDYVNVFGGPVKGKYSGLMIKNFLAAGGRVLFKRVIDKESASHSNYVVKNGKPQTEGTTTFNREGDFLKSETTAGKLYACSIEDKPFYVRAPKDGRRMTLASVSDQLSDKLGPTKAFYEAELKEYEDDIYGFNVKIDSGAPKAAAAGEASRYSFVSIKPGTPKETIINNIEIASKYYNAITVLEVASGYTAEEFVKNYSSINEALMFKINDNKVEVNLANCKDIVEIASKIQEKINNYNIKVIGKTEPDGADKLIFVRTAKAEDKITISSSEEKKPLFVNGEGVSNSSIQTIPESSESAKALFVKSAITSEEGTQNKDKFEIKMEENSGHLMLVDAAENKYIEIIGYADKPLSFKKTLKVEKNDKDLKNEIEVFKDLKLNKVVVKKTPQNPSLDAPAVSSKVIVTGETTIEVGDLVNAMKEVTEKNGTAEILDSAKDYVVFYSKEMGSGTTTLAVEVATSKNPVNNKDITKSLIVYNDGNIVERYENISLDPTDDENYFENVINATVDNGGSSYIGVHVEKINSGDVELPDGFWKIGQANKPDDKPLDPDTQESEYGSYNYMVGEDGIPVNDIDGSDGSYLFEEALDPIDSALSNKELYDFHIVQTPDNINPTVQDACIKMCETRGDVITIVDPPESLSRDGVIAWHNGETGRGALDSNYAAVYWPWCKVYDTTAGKGKYSWVMPSVVMAAQYAKVDKSVGPQMAPAGEKNGLLPVIDIENYPNPNDRDALYTNLNRINPISKFRDGSVVAYGEKTTQRKETVLTKIHTRRMLIQIKKQCRAALRKYIFMPNTTDYLGKINNAMVAILEPYKANGGLNSYKVVCDETNNPVESRQQDIINVDVVLIPQGTIEQININLTLDKAAETVKD